MKEVLIKKDGKEVFSIVVRESELKSAAKLGLTEREYIKARVKLALDEKLKEKNYE
jgi:hypothetical protein